MAKTTAILGLMMIISTEFASAKESSTYNDLKGSYSLITSKKTNENCPTGFWIGDTSVCPNSLWVQERRTHFTTVICNIDGGLKHTSTNGHPHSPIPNPERISTINKYNPSKKSLLSKSTSLSLDGLHRYYTIYTILNSGNLRFTRKYSDAPVFHCDYTKDASDDYIKSIE
jgi:hypothetical protein